MIADIKNFSFAEMTSNSTGKTSGSGFCGVYIVIVGMLAFLYGCYEFHYSGKADVMMYASGNILVGAGLLGYRKSMDKAPSPTSQEPTKENIPPIKEENGGGDIVPQ